MKIRTIGNMAIFAALGFMSSAALAVPLASDSAVLTNGSPSETFEVDATGAFDLFLTFSTVGGGTIDECDGGSFADCLDVLVDVTILFDDLSVSQSLTQYGPTALVVEDTIFDLVFDATITGSDETISIEWEITENVPTVPEPGTLALLGLGLIGLGFSRRKTS